MTAFCQRSKDENVQEWNYLSMSCEDWYRTNPYCNYSTSFAFSPFQFSPSSTMFNEHDEATCNLLCPYSGDLPSPREAHYDYMSPNIYTQSMTVRDNIKSKGTYHYSNGNATHTQWDHHSEEDSPYGTPYSLPSLVTSETSSPVSSFDAAWSPEACQSREIISMWPPFAISNSPDMAEMSSALAQKYDLNEIVNNTNHDLKHDAWRPNGTHAQYFDYVPALRPTMSFTHGEGMLSAAGRDNFHANQSIVPSQLNRVQEVSSVTESDDDHDHDLPIRTEPSFRLVDPSQYDDNKPKRGTSSTKQRKQNDQLLMELRDQGLSYKEIRRTGCFPEAESTLRGRVRVLRKPRHERVRRPNWLMKDIMLLREAAYLLQEVPSPLPPKDKRFHRDMTRPPRIQWTKVARYITDHGGSYPFAATACAKKWNEVKEALDSKPHK